MCQDSVKSTLRDNPIGQTTQFLQKLNYNNKKETYRLKRNLRAISKM